MPKSGRTPGRAPKHNGGDDLDINFRVDAAALSELEQLAGADIVRVVVWEESIVDAFDNVELTDPTSDIDIYLADGVRFELYAVLCYPSLESDPIADTGNLGALFDAQVASGLRLDDVATDTEDDLVLVLSATNQMLYVNAGAWSVDEWEELPD